MATLFVAAFATAADQPNDELLVCPLSPVVYGLPDGLDSNSGLLGWWHVNQDRSIWAGGAARLRAGADGNKMPWIRPKGTELIVSARRLDGAGTPATVQIPCCYPGRFQISGVIFPASGCWEVTARAGSSALTFVTFVQPGPSTKFDDG